MKLSVILEFESLGLEGDDLINRFMEVWVDMKKQAITPDFLELVSLTPKEALWI